MVKQLSLTFDWIQTSSSELILLVTTFTISGGLNLMDIAVGYVIGDSSSNPE